MVKRAGLEQALAVPGAGLVEHRLESFDFRSGRRQVGAGREVLRQPFVDEGEIAGGKHDVLGLLDQPVVLGMEDEMHRGQADVFVPASVAGDVVGVEHFVVIGRLVAARVDTARIADRVVGVGLEDAAGQHRDGRMCDVVEECAGRAQRSGETGRGAWRAGDHDVVGRIGNAVGPPSR